jgi:ADP-ribose pyrophosphatase YjhB (NUDIX family)
MLAKETMPVFDNSKAGSVDIKRAIGAIESLIGDPYQGLPEDVFLFASRITPMINVDLLIKNESNQTLLTWRDDGHWKAGWHIPGGIIRYKEKISQRIRTVARIELGAEVKVQAGPLAVNEFLHPGRRDRGHFISLLYECSLTTFPDEGLRYQSEEPRPHQWMWHNSCPDDIIEVHEIYREYI